jgi:hypothetical protein
MARIRLSRSETSKKLGKRQRDERSATVRRGEGTLTDNAEPLAGYSCDACNFETHTLPAGLVGLRFHGARHTAVSRMIAARVPLPMIAKIVGWTPGTMAKMAARYGHFGREELRGAVEIDEPD